VRLATVLAVLLFYNVIAYFVLYLSEEHSRTERNLLQSQQRFEYVAYHTQEWLWELGSAGEYIYSNLVVKDILGYSPEEIQGKLFHDFFTPKSREELKQAVFAVFEKKEYFKNLVSVYVHKDGSGVYLETSGIPVFGETGTFLGYRGVSRDITERKKAEEEREKLINGLKENQELFKKQKQELVLSHMAIKNVAEDLSESKRALEKQKVSLEYINKELDDFTYIVSHDLKEPLRSIDAFSKFLEDDYKDTIEEEGREYLKRIRANSLRMQNLIEDLLDISRIERRKSSFEEVDISCLFTEVNLRLEYAIKEKNVKVLIPDDLPRIFCDRVRMVEVFANLFSNAIKFNDKPNPTIEAGCAVQGDYYEFFVKDNGPGIEQQYFDKIFEIFQRLGKKEDHEGTGAGLTIVKKIIEMHNGKIWVDSKVGEYTAFYFTIPVKKEAIIGKKKIGRILVEKKLVTEEELKRALEEQEGAG